MGNISYFDRPDVTVDGNSIGVEYKGDTVYRGSTAHQEFELNNSGHYVIPYFHVMNMEIHHFGLIQGKAYEKSGIKCYIFYDGYVGGVY